MLLTSLKTTFVEKNAPYLSAQKLNDYWTSIEAIIDAMKTLPIDQGSWNATGATSTSYKLTSYRVSAPDASELPLAFVIVPTITNGLNATITASWGATAYQIWDMATNARVTAGIILANRPVQLVFDGTKFWVVGAAPIVHASQHEPGGTDVAEFVYYGGSQTLSSEQKTQARLNISVDAAHVTLKNQTISTSDWATYTAAAGEETLIFNDGYIYRKALTSASITSLMEAYIMPSKNIKLCGAQVNSSGITYSGGLYLYAKSIPTSSFTLLCVDCFEVT